MSKVKENKYHMPPFQTIFGRNYFKYKVTNYLDFFDVAEKGLHARVVIGFMDYFNINVNKMANLLDTSTKTVYNWQKPEIDIVLEKTKSMKLLELSDLFLYGIGVFESNSNFFEWLYEPNKALGGNKPSDLLYSEVGKKMVRDILIRIVHGVYS